MDINTFTSCPFSTRSSQPVSKLSLIFAWTTGEFLISSRFKRIAAITAAAINFAFSVLADCRARLKHSGDGAGDPSNIASCGYTQDVQQDEQATSRSGLKVLQMSLRVLGSRGNNTAAFVALNHPCPRAKHTK